MKWRNIGVIALLLAGCSKESETSESAGQFDHTGEAQVPQGKLIQTVEWKGLVSGYYNKVSYYDNGECIYE